MDAVDGGDKKGGQGERKRDKGEQKGAREKKEAKKGEGPVGAISRHDGWM